MMMGSSKTGTTEVGSTPRHMSDNIDQLSLLLSVLSSENMDDWEPPRLMDARRLYTWEFLDSVVKETIERIETIEVEVDLMDVVSGSWQ